MTMSPSSPVSGHTQGKASKISEIQRMKYWPVIALAAVRADDAQPEPLHREGLAVVQARPDDPVPEADDEEQGRTRPVPPMMMLWLVPAAASPNGIPTRYGTIETRNASIQCLEDPAPGDPGLRLVDRGPVAAGPHRAPSPRAPRRRAWRGPRGRAARCAARCRTAPCPGAPDCGGAAPAVRPAGCPRTHRPARPVPACLLLSPPIRAPSWVLPQRRAVPRQRVASRTRWPR